MDYERKLADMIAGYSIDVKEDENVLISFESIEAVNFVECLIDEINKRKGNAFVRFDLPRLHNMALEKISDSGIKVLEKEGKLDVENYDSFISIRSNFNDYEGVDVPNETRKKIGKRLAKSRDIRVNNKKWVLLNYPTSLDASKMRMPTKKFYEYAFKAMCYDYRLMKNDILPLKELMEKTDMVRIVAPGTDISFSIKGMNMVPCCGEKNIPDGEIYCAPIKNSVNGVIKYNTPSPYQGLVFHGVTLTFKDGKIIKASCDEQELVGKLEEIFNSDEGARYVGEFSFGLNPFILNPMGDILFDEKIIGSIHFTPGSAYKDSYNGNDSVIHWDMVLIQRPEYGGGEIYFDDVLIRKDGLFVLDELKPLNGKETSN